MTVGGLCNKYNGLGRKFARGNFAIFYLHFLKTLWCKAFSVFTWSAIYICVEAVGRSKRYFSESVEVQGITLCCNILQQAVILLYVEGQRF